MGYVWTVIFFQGDLEGKLKVAEEQKEIEKREKLSSNGIWWAESSANAKQFDEAISTIEEVLENDPLNGYAVMTKARILKRQALQPGEADRNELLKQAIAWADRSILLMPGKGEPYYNKACYQALLDPIGLKGEVLENLRSALRVNPGLRHIAEGDDDLGSLSHDADFISLINQKRPPDA